MAKAYATCKCATCGQEFTKISYKANRSQADSWEKWAAENFTECEDCYSERIKKEREEENAKAAAEAEQKQLPELKGSEKQVAWANSIRKKILDSVDKIEERLNSRIEKARELGYAEEKIQKEVSEFRAIKEELVAKDEARFWIDKRDMYVPSYFESQRNKRMMEEED